MMNLEEWKERFKASQKDNRWKWYLDELGLLYMIHGVFADESCLCCPITAEFGIPSDDVSKCARSIDIDIKVSEKIISASDYNLVHDTGLRKWLLKTCGVDENQS